MFIWADYYLYCRLYLFITATVVIMYIVLFIKFFITIFIILFHFVLHVGALNLRLQGTVTITPATLYM